LKPGGLRGPPGGRALRVWQNVAAGFQPRGQREEANRKRRNCKRAVNWPAGYNPAATRRPGVFRSIAQAR